jgi:hypothetical protein
MSFQFDTLHITHQLTTGIGYPECFGLDNKVIRGSVYLDGPTITGDENTFRTVEGSVMIGPCNNTDSPLPKVCDGTKFHPKWEISPCGRIGEGNPKGPSLYDPYSLVVRSGPHLTRDPSTSCSTDGAGPGQITTTPSNSASLFIGDVDITGSTRIFNKLSVKDNSDFDNDVIIKNDLLIGNDLFIGGTVCIGGSLSLDGDLSVGGDLVSDTLDGDPVGRLLARIQVADSLPVKPFDIPHPSKEKYRLRHVCLEGPEVGVYFRGRVKNKTEIELPDYWKDLVNETSITVQLQPIGAHQDLIVKRIMENKIFLQSRGGMPIDCFYHVYGERKDVEKLIVEYEGKTKSDYPSTSWRETYPEEFGEKA